MTPSTLLKHMLFMLSILFLLSGISCATGPGYVEGGEYGPDYGYSEGYTYWYYPHVNVYFDTGRNVYFYREHNMWRKSRRLPRRFQPGLRDHVIVKTDSDKPYYKSRRYRREMSPERMREPDRRWEGSQERMREPERRREEAFPEEREYGRRHDD